MLPASTPLRRMRASLHTCLHSVLLTSALLCGLAWAGDMPPAASPGAPGAASRTIPFSQLGAEVDAKAQAPGEEPPIAPTSGGARLRAMTQDLEGEVTREGLWLSSASDEDAHLPNRFRIRAMEISRAVATPHGVTMASPRVSLATTGTVQATEEMASFTRPGLVEEYMVSADGVRQDFVVLERPQGGGTALSVLLEVTGARAESSPHGARLTVSATGRELAYSRLKVMDATGRELPAEMQVDDAQHVRITVQDTAAVYPVRIDPTFSDADWVSMSPGVSGTNGIVRAVALDSAGTLYITGNFTVVGTVVARNVARWNGSTWSALGSGLDDDGHALATSGTTLYAGGDFTSAGGVTANRIARWDGTSWSALGSGMDYSVYSLLTSGTDLYAGGSFYHAGGTSARCIAKWNGTSWSALSTGINGDVYALARIGTDIYAGGLFGLAGGYSADSVAKWDGTNWSALGSGITGQVRALAAIGTTLYAGVTYEFSGSVRRWDGSAWSYIGSGLRPIRSLAVSGTTLYAGGDAEQAEGPNRGSLYRWSGSSWTTLNSSIEGTVHGLAASGSDIYLVGTSLAGGKIYREGASPANLAPGTGFDGEVYALAVVGTDLYVGGSFTNGVRKWNGSTWSGVTPGLEGTVKALAVMGSHLYVGGEFVLEVSGFYYIYNFARWTGTSWSLMNNGVSGSVEALAVIGSDVYVGGSFTTIDHPYISRLARWSGSAWSSVGTGVNARVSALAVSGTDLYAGGHFTTAGSVSAQYVARWNGGTWAALGSGADYYVHAIALSGSNLYAASVYPSSSTVSRWNGSSWTTLGSAFTGNGGEIRSLAVRDGEVYAGGSFTSPARNLTKWNGSAWSAVGTGVEGAVNAIAVDGAAHIFVGGEFYVAGSSMVSPFLVAGHLNGTPDLALAVDSGTALADDAGSIAFGAVAEGTTSTVRTFTITNTGTGDLLAPTVTVTGSHPGDFILDTSGIPSPLSPGSSATFTVAFRPTTTGTRSGGLAITSNVIGPKMPYTITLGGTGLSTNAALASLTASSGTFSPTFASGTTEYQIPVFNVTSITLTPTLAQADATLRVNGTLLASGATSSVIPLEEGSNTITVLVTAQDGTTTRTYTLDVVRRTSRIGIELNGTPLTDGNPTPVHIGDAAFGYHRTRTFTLKNTGAAPLHVLSMDRSGTGAAWFIVSVPPVSPVSGPTGESSFTVWFSAAAFGNSFATLHVVTDDPFTPSFDIALSGSTHYPVSGVISMGVPAVTVLPVMEHASSPVTVSIPISRTSGIDGDVGFTIRASGGSATSGVDYTPPTALQTLSDGQDTKLVPITILPSAASEPNETFNVTISSPTGGATLGTVKTVTVRIIDAVDASPPSPPVVSAPALNGLITPAPATGLYTVSGTAKDDKGVASVEVKLNGNLVGNAVLTAPGTASTGWSIAIAPTMEVNALTVQSTDTHSKTSSVTTQNFRSMRPLAVAVNAAHGSVTTGYAPTSYREIGKAYTIAATAKTTPAPGYLFDRWVLSGGYAAVDIGVQPYQLELATLTFTMREGLTLTPQFAANAFTAVAGTYNGLSRAAATFAPGMSTEGAFTVTLQPAGAFSAKLMLDGQTLNINGLFDNAGHARFGTTRETQIVVTREGKPSLILSDLDLDDATGTIEGLVTLKNRTTTVAQAEVYADRAAFSAGNLTAPYIGTYTAIIGPQPEASQPAPLTEADYPTGCGYGTVTITRFGVLSFSGTLSDGTTPVSMSSTLSADYHCGLFAQLYSKLGFLITDLVVDTLQEESDIVGDSSLWLKPYQDIEHHPYGWPEVLKLNITAARYRTTFTTAPTTRSVLLGPDDYDTSEDGDQEGDALPDVNAATGNVTLRITSPLMTGSIVAGVNVAANDAVTELSGGDPRFSFSIKRSTGMATGTFINPDTAASTPFSAMIYQKGQKAGAHGFFLTPTPKLKTYEGYGGLVELKHEP